MVEKERRGVEIALLKATDMYISLSSIGLYDMIIR